MRTEEILIQIEKTIKSKSEMEYFHIHIERYRFILDKILKLNLPMGSNILDLGCFPPHLFQALESLGFEVWGIASKHEPMKLKKVVSINIESDPIPLKENYFDLILFSEVIEHLVVSPKIYFPKLEKLLKRDGLILITTPNAAHLKNRMKLLLGQSPNFGIDQLYQTKWGDDSVYYRHNREFTASELKQIMKDLPVGRQSQKLKIKDWGYFASYTPWRQRSSRLSLSSQLVKWGGYFVTMTLPWLKDSQYLLVSK